MMVTAHINVLWFLCGQWPESQQDHQWPCLPLQPVSHALSILHWPALPRPFLPSPLRKLSLCLETIRYQFIILPDSPSLGSSDLTSGSRRNFPDRPPPQSKFCVPFYSSTISACLLYWTRSSIRTCFIFSLAQQYLACVGFSVQAWRSSERGTVCRRGSRRGQRKWLYRETVCHFTSRVMNWKPTFKCVCKLLRSHWKGSGWFLLVIKSTGWQ